MRAILSFGAIVSVLHFFEDAALLLLGRYTEINIYILFVGTIIFGMLVAAVAKNTMGSQIMAFLWTQRARLSYFIMFGENQIKKLDSQGKFHAQNL